MTILGEKWCMKKKIYIYILGEKWWCILMKTTTTILIIFSESNGKNVWWKIIMGDPYDFQQQKFWRKWYGPPPLWFFTKFFKSFFTKNVQNFPFHQNSSFFDRRKCDFGQKSRSLNISEVNLTFWTKFLRKVEFRKLTFLLAHHFWVTS